MSQYIKKLQTGGTIVGSDPSVPKEQVVVEAPVSEEEQPVLFQTSSGKYDAAKLAELYEKNIPLFAEHIGFRRGSKKYNQFLNEAAKIQRGLRDGSLRRGDGMIYSGTFLGDDNKMQSYGLGLLDKILESAPQYEEPKAKEKEKYNFGALRKYFWNRFYGGNEDADLQSWVDRDALDDNGVRGNTNRANALAQMLTDYAGTLNDDSFDFQGSAFHDLADYKQKLAEAAASLADGTYDNNDATALDAIGFGRSLRERLLGNGQEEKVDDDPESYNNQLKMKKKELDAELKAGVITQEEYRAALQEFTEDWKDRKYGDATYNRNYQNWANNHWGWTGDTFNEEQQLDTRAWDQAMYDKWNGISGTSEADSTPSWLSDQRNAQYADKLLELVMNGQRINPNQLGPNGMTNSNILRGIMMEFENNPSYITPVDEDRFYLNKTINYENGTALMYNKKTKQFSRVHVSDSETPLLYQYLKSEYQKKNPRRRRTSAGGAHVWAKYGAKLEALRTGGIIKAASGYDLAALGQQANQQNDAERELRYEAEAKARNMSVEDVKKGKQKAGTQKGSSLRKWSTNLDIASGIASFVPVIGNAIGAIGGTAGTVGNLIADAMDDSVSRSEMMRNLAINAGMTGLMLIPGGGLVKAGKAAAQLGMTGLGAYNVLSNLDRIKELRAKDKAGTLSHEEARELDAYYSMASGAATGTKSLSGQAATKFGNNIAGKAAAFVSDPILALSPSRNAKAAFRGLYQPMASTSEGVGRGNSFLFTDANGNEIKVSAKQKKAMKAAFDKAVKAEGATSESVNKAVGEAWAKAGTSEQALQYSNTRHQANVLWSDDVHAGNWLTNNADPTSPKVLNMVDVDGNAAEIKLSVQDQKNMRSAYKAAADAIGKDKVMEGIGKPANTEISSLSAAEKTAYDTKLAELQEAAGLDAAKSKFEGLSQVKAHDISVDVNPIAPVVMPDGWTKSTGWTSHFKRGPKIGDFTDEVGFWDGMKTESGYAYDPKTVEGLRNLRMRVDQRAADRAYLGKGLGWVMDYLNTNAEMSRGMGAVRTRTDNVLDNKIITEREIEKQAGKPGTKAYDAKQFQDWFGTRKDKQPVLDYIADYERVHGPQPQYKKTQLAKEYLKGTAGAGPKIMDNLFDGLNPEQQKALREYYSGKIDPHFDPNAATPRYADDVDIALMLREDMGRGLKSEEIANQRLIEGRVGTYGAKDAAGNLIADDLYATTTSRTKLNDLADYARRNGIAAADDSDVTAVYKLSNDPAHTALVNADLQTKFDTAKSLGELEAWKASAGSEMSNNAELRARSVGSTVSEAEFRALRDRYNANKSAFDRLEAAEATRGGLTNSERQKLNDYINKNNDEFSKTGTGSALTDTDIQNELVLIRTDEAAEKATARKIASYGFDPDEIAEIQTYAQARRENLKTRHPDMSEYELNTKTRQFIERRAQTKDAINKANAQRAENAAKSQIAAANNKLSTKLKGKLTVKTETEKNQILGEIDVVTDRLKDMLPENLHDVNGRDVKIDIENYLLQEVHGTSKTVADIEAEFANAIRKTKRGSFVELDNLMDRIMNADDSIEIKVKAPKTIRPRHRPAPTPAGGGTTTTPTTGGAPTGGTAAPTTSPSTTTAPTPAGGGTTTAPSFKHGGILERMRSLRDVNFTSDDINATAISSNAKGGILKAADGDKVVQNPEDWAWYNDLWKQKNLGNANLRNRNQFANSDLNANDHNKNFDLGQAAAKNDAYTSQADIVGDDLQRYYQTAYNTNNIDDFISHYNTDAGKIRSFWGVQPDGSTIDTAYSANTDKGQNIQDHNRLFRSMFYNRSQNSNNRGINWNIGYQDNIDDTMGTQTWMRRMDRYKTEWDKDTLEGKMSRVHPIKLSNGETAYVYKKANGDIAKLTEEQANSLMNEGKPKPAAGEITGENTGRGGGFNTSGDGEGSNWLNKARTYLDGNMNKLAYDALGFGRYLSNRKNNKRVLQEMLNIRTSLKDPMNMHRYTYGDYLGQESQRQQGAQIQSQAGKSKSSDANINNAAALEGASTAGKMDMQGNAIYNDRMYKTGENQLSLNQNVYQHNLQTQTQNSAALAELANNKTRAKSAYITYDNEGTQNYLSAIQNMRGTLWAQDRQKKEYAQNNYDSIMMPLDFQQWMNSRPEYNNLKKSLLDPNISPEEFYKRKLQLKQYEATKGLQDKIDIYNEWAKRKGLKLYNMMDLRSGSPTKRSIDSYTVAGIPEAKKGIKIDDTNVKRSKSNNDRLAKQIADSCKLLSKSIDRLSKDELNAIKRFLK